EVRKPPRARAGRREESHGGRGAGLRPARREPRAALPHQGGARIPVDPRLRPARGAPAGHAGRGGHPPRPAPAPRVDLRAAAGTRRKGVGVEMLPELRFGSRPRLPVFLQTEAAECGLASLGMVACFHGHRVDLAGLRRRFTVSLKGATLAYLMQAAGRLHLAPRPLRLELAELSQLRLPCILHWDLNHFVVLKAADSRGIVVHDPAFGIRRLSLAEVSKHFTGIALELSPTVEFRPADERRRVRLHDLLGRVDGLHRSLGQVFLLALALQAIAIVSPFYMQWAVDGAVVSSDRDLLTVLGLGFLMLVVIQVTLSILRSWVVLYLGTTLNLQWLANVFSHLLRLPVSYFEKRHLGDVVSRFGAVNAIQRTLSSTFVEAMIDGV